MSRHCQNGIAASLVLALILCVAAPAAAQTPISTDRPGFGSSTSVLTPGRVQAEVGTPGVSYTSASETSSISFPALLRVGVTDWAEVRLESSVYNILRVGDNSTDGFGGLTVGAKINPLRKAKGAFTGLVVIPSVVLPVGDGVFADDDLAYSVEADASFALSPDVGLGLAGLVQYRSRDDVPNTGDGTYFYEGFVAANVSRGLREGLSGYAEAAYNWADAGDAGPDPVYLGAGLTYLVSPTAQLDAFFDREVTSTEGSDWLFGAGLSVRLDP